MGKNKRQSWINHNKHIKEISELVGNDRYYRVLIDQAEYLAITIKYPIKSEFSGNVVDRVNGPMIIGRLKDNVVHLLENSDVKLRDKMEVSYVHLKSDNGRCEYHLSREIESCEFNISSLEIGLNTRPDIDLLMSFV